MVDNDDINRVFHEVGNDGVGCFPNIAAGFAVGHGVHEERFSPGDSDAGIGIVANPFTRFEVVAKVRGKASDLL